MPKILDDLNEQVTMTVNFGAAAVFSENKNDYFVFKPTSIFVGSYKIRIYLQDASGNKESYSFTLTVKKVDEEPEIDNQVADASQNDT